VRALAALAALAVGVVSGAAGALLHQRWWGLALALATALVVLAWLPPGGVRLAFAVGWCVAALRGAVTRSGGGFLVGSDAAGWSFMAASVVLLLAALLSAGAGRRRRPRHADDHGDRGPVT
jgi:hypothetical protein